MQQVVLLGNKTLSEKALDLLHFDRDSILQAAAGRQSAKPTVFVADPDGYERNGRLLRDSESPRLLAYSPGENILYANDGCNSCTHQLQVQLAEVNSEGLRVLAADNRIPESLLIRIAELAG